MTERTILIDETNYRVEKKCADERLIQRLIDEHILNQTRDVGYYKNDCVDIVLPKITTTDQIGVGSYNTIFKIPDLPDKVFRLSKEGLSITTLNSQVAGLFIQYYLFGKCPDTVCQVFEFGFLHKINKDGQINKDAPPRVYAILERLDGNVADLYDNKFKVDKTILYSAIKDVIKNAFEALLCLSNIEYVHLDLKPENIGVKKIDGKFVGKLIDFDFARYVDNGKMRWKGSRKYTDTNFFNTCLDDYKTNKEPVGEFSIKSDIYSMGVILIILFFDYGGILKLNPQIDKSANFAAPITIVWANKYKIYNIEGDEINNLIGLINLLIRPKPSKRINAHDALNSDWFKTITLLREQPPFPREEQEQEQVPVPNTVIIDRPSRLGGKRKKSKRHSRNGQRKTKRNGIV